jgi:pimeloyl-ACP methyl ester carboxylesterase
MRGSQNTGVLRTIDEATLRHDRQADQACDPMRSTDAEALFHGLLDDALAEITRREPVYLSRFELVLPLFRKQVRRHLAHPLFASFSETEMEAALASAIRHFRKRGVSATVRENDGDGDPVAMLLCCSIADAYAASLGRLTLFPAVKAPDGDIAHGYEDRRTVNGARYLVRCAGQSPLLLINACGMSLSLWRRLMMDQSARWRLIVPESPCTDLLQGGMRTADDLSAEIGAIAAALDDAAVDRTDLLAWCSGARVAVEFAARFPERVRSLVLVSPTLRGAEGVVPAGSNFENDMNRIFEAVDRGPYLAPAFANAFTQSEFTDWEKLANKPDQRAVTLFGLPAREHLPALIAPMVSPDFIVNYARRVLADQKHAVHASLARLKMPVMLLLGDCDNRVNNSFTVAALKASGVRFLRVEVRGAGHYIYDLQYQYFRSILSTFLAGGTPTPSARVEVESVT